jgi:hypothetical protein
MKIKDKTTKALAGIPSENIIEAMIQMATVLAHSNECTDGMDDADEALASVHEDLAGSAARRASKILVSLGDEVCQASRGSSDSDDGDSDDDDDSYDDDDDDDEESALGVGRFAVAGGIALGLSEIARRLKTTT